VAQKRGPLNFLQCMHIRLPLTDQFLTCVHNIYCRQKKTQNV